MPALALAHPTTATAAPTSCELLTFRLGEEEYGIDILKVQEIRGYDAVTRIAGAPAFIKGVINLRGTIVPIVDLRIKLGLPQPTYDQFTVVIILHVAGRISGIVVDAVSDVLHLAAEQIRPAPDFGHAGASIHVLGLASLDDHTIILADIEKMMSGPGMELVESDSALAA
jgi:purine-binding chemotaxis protein CheW